MSERALIADLRARFRDAVHPLSQFELRSGSATVRLEYSDNEGRGRKGAFRVHPRLPALQVWPDASDGQRFLRAMGEHEERIRDRVDRYERIQRAKEAVAVARYRGTTPRQEDWETARGAMSPSRRAARTQEEADEGRTVRISEILGAMEQERRMLIDRDGALPLDPVRVRLKGEAPLKLRASVPINLAISYDRRL
jgi:hypothetical protein